MNFTTQTIFAASLGWLAVFIVASLVGAMLYSLFRHVGKFVAPEQRTISLLAYAGMPLLVASAVSMALYFPVLSQVLLPAHCHGGNCAPHAPEFAVTAAYAAMITIAALAAISLLFYLPIQQLIRHRRKSQLVKKLSTPAALRGFHVIENDAVMAWCDGLFSPAIFVSQGLLEQVNESELAIVLAHEEAHAERRDNLARLIIDWTTRLWPVSKRRGIREDFTLASEQACDALASSKIGDTAEVAAVISRLSSTNYATAKQSREPSASTEQRIAALATEKVAHGPAQFGPWLMLMLLGLAEAYVFAQVAHPFLEWLSH